MPGGLSCGYGAGDGQGQMAGEKREPADLFFNLRRIFRAARKADSHVAAEQKRAVVMAAFWDRADVPKSREVP